jgi:hypothetical protein
LDGIRQRKSVSTGLPVKGNKGVAEDKMYELRKEQEAFVRSNVSLDKLKFADFMERWLDVIRPEVKATSFGGYQLNVQKVIAPYFRERGILLTELTADDINAFYKSQLRRVKATIIYKYHANISNAIKYAVEKNYIPYSIMDKAKRSKPERFVGKFPKLFAKTVSSVCVTMISGTIAP